MLNPFKEVNWHPDLATRRTFARSLVIGFPCLAVVLVLENCVLRRTEQPQQDESARKKHIESFKLD